MRALRMHACGMRTRRSTSSRRSRNARSSTKSPTVTERSAACPRRSPRARTTLCAQCKVCAVLCRRLTAAQGCCAVWAVRTRLPTPLLLSPPVGSRHGRGLSDFLARQRSKTSSWTSISVRRARSVPPGSAMSTGTARMLRATFMRRAHGWHAAQSALRMCTAASRSDVVVALPAARSVSARRGRVHSDGAGSRRVGVGSFLLEGFAPLTGRNSITV